MREAKRSGREEDCKNAKVERNRVSRLIETAKADFLKEQQEELADDPKKFWRVVKSIVPGKRISLVEKVDGEGEMEITRSKVADHINEFFAGIGPKLAKEHNEPCQF